MAYAPRPNSESADFGNMELEVSDLNVTGSINVAGAIYLDGEEVTAGGGGGPVAAADVTYDDSANFNVIGEDVQEALTAADGAVHTALVGMSNLNDDLSTIRTASLIASNESISDADKGRTYTITAACTITLPACEEGLWYRFQVAGAGDIAITFACQAGDDYTGGQHVAEDGAFHSFSAAASFQVGNGTANPGDWIEIHGINTTNWIVSGFARLWA